MAREVASPSAVVGRVKRVIFRRGFSFGQGALHQDVDRAAVFRVHADHAAVLGGLQHGVENRGVVQHEDAGIGHEKFEGRNAFAHQRAHFLELRVAQLRDDAVEGVIGHGFAFGFFHPGVEGVAQRLAFVLNGEIDQRGGAAEGRGARAGLEIVGAGGAAEGHVQMRVHVDAAGDDEAVPWRREFSWRCRWADLWRSRRSCPSADADVAPHTYPLR